MTRLSSAPAPGGDAPRPDATTAAAPADAPLGPTVVAGIVGAVTGFASAFAVVLAGLTAVGATPAEAASGLFALCIGQAVLAIALSWRSRLPLSFAWSTPGAAVLVAAKATTGSFEAAVGAFLLCAVLVVITGAWSRLANLLGRIPQAVSGALLAGVLLPLCLSPVSALKAHPVAAGLVIVVWLGLTRFAPRWATPAAIVVAIVATVLLAGGDLGAGSWWPSVQFVVPHFEPVVLVSLGLPLYVVTMAGQNVPGLAVLDTLGYRGVPTRTVLVGTGLASGVGAFFGAHAMNLSALSAAIMAGPSAHPDPRRRWVAAVAGGFTYVGLALAAGAATRLIGGTSPVLIEAAAGLALLGAFTGGLVSALKAPQDRLAAGVTFLVVASGVAVLGIGSAFWGLVAGAVVFAVTRARGARQ